MPGGGRVVGGACGIDACCCGGGGGGLAACTGGGGGGGGLGGSIGLHIASLSLSSASRAASSAFSLFWLSCASSSYALSTGVGSAGGSGGGGAGVSSVARFIVGSTGAHARSTHEVMSTKSSSRSPNSKALTHGAQPTRVTAGTLARTAAGRAGTGTGGGAKACRLAAASAS